MHNVNLILGGISMFKRTFWIMLTSLFVTFAVIGCTQQPAQPVGPTTNDLNTKIDNIVNTGIYGFGPSMRGVSDSIDNMYFAAKGGNWGLASFMGDLMGDYMSPTQLTEAKDYPDWDAFYKKYLGDPGALRTAMDAGDMVAFDKAYTDVLANGCNACHEKAKVKFIKKIKASAPETNLDYTVQSKASENQK